MLELIVEHFIDVSVEDAKDHPRGVALLEQIVLYPVKSCGAMRVSSWKLSSAGLDMDRQFLIMRGRKAVTQKQLRYVNNHSHYFSLLRTYLLKHKWLEIFGINTNRH